MITGDHAVTAGAIARELGIVRAGEDAGGARARARHARGQAAHRARVEGAGRDRGDDRRRRQRRARAARGAHRHRHGPERDGGDARGVRHGPGRRQLREHRRGGARGPRHLRQHPQDAGLPAGREHRASSLVMLVAALVGPAAAVAAAAPALDQPRDRRAARAGAGHGPGRRRHPAPPAAAAGGAAAGPPRVERHRAHRARSKPTVDAGGVRLGAARSSLVDRRAISRSTRWCSASCSARSRRAARRSCSGRSACSTTCASCGVVVVSAFIQIGIHQIPAVARLFQHPGPAARRRGRCPSCSP